MRVVLVASAAFAVIMTLLGIDRYVTYHSGADLGEFVQTIATPLGGFGDTPEGGSHFLHHFSPILYLASPLLLALRTPVVLIAFQAIAGALVAPAVFMFARSRMDERLATLAACASLLYPALVGVVFTDFHENGFAPAAVLWLFVAVDRRRWALAGLLLVLILAIKEDEALIMAALGIGYAVVSARRKDHQAAFFAVAGAAVAVAVFAGYFAVVRPAAGGHGAWFALDYYEGHSFDTPHGAAIVVGRITFLLEALVPLALVPLLTPGFLWVLPGLIEVLSSRWAITYTMGQHYAGAWIGEMLAAYVLGLASVARTRPTVARNLAVASIVLSVLNLAVASPTHWGHYLRMRTSHDAALDALVRLVPPDAGVATYDEVYSHLGFDPKAQIGFAPDALPPYALFDERYDGAAWRTMYRPQLEALVRQGRYRPLQSSDGATLYERTP